MELSGCGAGPICPASCWLGNVIQSGCGPGCKSSGSRLGTAWSARESHVPIGAGQSVRQSQVPSEALSLSNDTKHAPAWQLLGQRTDGATVPKSEIRVDTGPGLSKSA